MKKCILLTLLFSITVCNLGFSQTPLTHKEKIQAIYNANKSLVKTQDYSFVASWVFTNSKRAVVAEGLNTLEINKTKAKGLLAVLDANDKALVLNGSISNYNANYNDDKHEISITYQLAEYQANLIIKPNGNAFLTLNTADGKTIKYRGFVN